MTSAGRDPVPRERGGWWRWVWLVWAAFASACLFVSTLILLTGITATAPQQFKGELRPQAMHMELRLPAGIPLKEIVVSADQEVAAGQTIAVLDRGLIDQQFTETARDILVKRALRLCLLNGVEAIPGFDPSSGMDAETGIQLETALQDCQTLHRTHALQLQRLAGTRSRILGRITLLEQREAVAVALAPGALNKASASASFFAERTRLVGLAARLEHEAATLKTLLHRERIARVSGLEDEARTLKLRQAVLRGYLNNPRLQAPQAGKIVRARSFPEGGVFVQEAVLATLKTEAKESHRVIFPLTADEARSLKPGLEVDVRMAGQLQNSALLTGVIAAIEPPAPGQEPDAPVQAAVSLSEGSLERIKNSTGLQALGGAGTAALVHVSTAPRFLSALLGRQLADVISTAALPIWK